MTGEPVTGEPVTEYLIRPATETDLDALADFEVEIAQVSFGDEAITTRRCTASGWPGRWASRAR